MTPLKSTFILACLFYVNVAQLQQKTGDSCNLTCAYEDSDINATFSWYKQTPGQKPQLVREQKDKYFISKGHSGKGKFDLTIHNLDTSDSATYFCILSSSNNLKIRPSISVSVNDPHLNISAVVHQSATIQPGGSVTLNCTVHTGSCDEREHRVYWFKNSEESHPGIIYTHGGSNDQCESEPNTQTHTCVYNLPMKSLNLSHAGTYYCAVASCGHIIFGDMIKLDFRDKTDLLILVIILSGCLGFTAIFVVILSFLLCKRKRTYPEFQARFSTRSTVDSEGNQEADLHYAALSFNPSSSPRRLESNSVNECVYSSVK